MAERAFLVAVMVMSAGYLALAALTIRAPIAYDPLGPQSWPVLLGGLATIAAFARLLRPIGTRFEASTRALTRVGVVAAALVLYAWTFERLGFVLATWAFCTAVTALLGTRLVPALVFGGAIGLGAFALFTYALDLRLPVGDLVEAVPWTL